MKHRTQGFSLVELIVALSVGAVLMSAAVPAYRDYVAGSRLSVTTNTFLAHVQATRSEAITRGRPVTMCASADGAGCGGAGDWKTSWLVFTDADGEPGVLDGGDELLHTARPAQPDLRLEAEDAYLRFDSMGILDPD